MRLCRFRRADTSQLADRTRASPPVAVSILVDHPTPAVVGVCRLSDAPLWVADDVTPDDLEPTVALVDVLPPDTTRTFKLGYQSCFLAPENLGVPRGARLVDFEAIRSF
jgi:hypothetical protein